MARRIIYLLLAVVLILAIILGIRWWLNRGGGETVEDVVETVVDETADVVGEVEESVTDLVTEDEAPSGETGAEVAPESPAAGDETAPAEGDAVAEGEAAPPAEGETATEGETTTAGETTPPADSTGTGDQEATAPESGTAVGGTNETGDPNVGGGVVEGADSAAGDTAVAPGESGGAGTGGVATTTQTGPVVPGQPVQHTVNNLEWLTQLARCYGTTVADIQAANKFVYPDLIQPGWVVNIPNPGNASAITINETPCFTYYTVQAGENLYRIAERYGISYQWLARINAIYNYNLIYAGQVLVIPNPVPPELTAVPQPR